MMLTAVGIDIMLPAFSEIRRYFGLPDHSPDTAYIVTAFFWGQVFQLLFGIISDRHGRLPVLRIGFPLYIAGGIAAAFSPTLSIMFLCRFIAGIGASAVFMTTIAMVRDRFEGDEMARIMSFIFTIFLFTPVIAPFLGSAVLHHSSWQTVFLLPPAFGLIIFLWSFRLKESLPLENRNKVSIPFRQVLTNRSFLRYTAVTTLLFGGLSTYVSNSEFIVSEIYKRPALFAWIFGSVGIVMALGALTNSKLVIKYGARKTIRGLLIAYLCIAVILLADICFFHPLPNLYFFFVCIAILLGINLAVEPNSSALAMQKTGETAGLASSLYGTIFFFAGAMLGSVISYFLTIGLLAIAIGFVIIGTIALLLTLNDKLS